MKVVEIDVHSVPGTVCVCVWVFLEHVCTAAVSTASFQVAVDFYTYWYFD